MNEATGRPEPRVDARRAAADLLPTLYEQLRALAAAQVARESPGQTLTATALVHEAYLRLVGAGDGPRWDGRGHFYAAASEAMRRILVDRARARRAAKRGGGVRPAAIELDGLASPVSDDQLLDLDAAFDTLAAEEPEAADVARLHVFGGLSVAEAGEALGLSRATAYRDWAFARAWLKDALGSPEIS